MLVCPESYVLPSVYGHYIPPTVTMSQQQDENNIKDDQHEQDMVMPGFRFYPTEEELIEFYLRRKVEGKRFNVELITFLDLYRYDPWELPALAAIGEKEWFFYVPRDRKYRNGDRPNRVTTSGYWKATGADKMIRTENLRSIGLKKTLVFYSGKAPKGIRTSWIMNEYRLPHHDIERQQKAEISLCRVHKRAGVEDHPSLPQSLSTRALSSSSSSLTSDKRIINDVRSHETMEKFNANYNVENPHDKQMIVEQKSGSSTDIVGTSLPLITNHNSNHNIINPNLSPFPLIPSLEINDRKINLHQITKDCSQKALFHNPSFVSLSSSSSSCGIDDLHTLVNFQNDIFHHQHYQVNPNHSSLPSDMQSEPSQQQRS